MEGNEGLNWLEAGMPETEQSPSKGVKFPLVIRNSCSFVLQPPGMRALREPSSEANSKQQS